MKQLLMHPRFPLFAASLAGLAILSWLVLGFLATSQEEKRLEKAQASLIEAIAQNQRGKASKLIHRDYSDNLGHDRTQALERIFELRAQVSSLNLEHEMPVIAKLDEEAKKAELSLSFTELDGGGGLFGDAVIPRLRQSGILEAEFKTSWKREGLWPGKWKLVELRFDDKLKIPASYEPAKKLREQISSGLEM